MTPNLNITDEQVTQRDAFLERLLQSAGGMFDIFTVYRLVWRINRPPAPARSCGRTPSAVTPRRPVSATLRSYLSTTFSSTFTGCMSKN